MPGGSGRGRAHSRLPEFPLSLHFRPDPIFAHPPSPLVVSIVVVLLVLSGGWAESGAQEALVLSGGGSRGLAHAGAIVGIEEAGYDPDVVVGTSMGAVVGALYAAGYDPAEILDRLAGVSWRDIFIPTPVPVGAEREVRFPTISFDVEIDRLRVGRGLVGQWRVNRALARLLFDANARARGDFDRLPRRFRAVAADLESGEAVILAEGDLARAARASFSVPGFFAPVHWEGRVLIDGGIVDNLPLSVARGLGGEYVIAVDVSRPHPEIVSEAPLAVIGRALDLMQENTQRDPAPPDALILPGIDPSLSAASFPSDPWPLFRLGLAAARVDLPARSGAPPGEERPSALPPDSLHELVLEAPDSGLARLARRVFEDVAPGPYDVGAVLHAMDRLYTTGLFEAVWPRVIERPAEEGGGPALLVRLDAPPRMSLSAAAGYGNDRGGRAWAALDRYTAVADRPAVLTVSASLQELERWGAVSARIYSLARPGFAWSGGLHVTERDVRFFAEDVLGAKEVLRVGGWVSAELPHLLRDRAAAVALRAGWIDVEEGTSGFSVGPLLRLATLDDDALVVGVPFLAEGEARWGGISYSRVALAGSRAVSMGPFVLAPLVDVRAVSSGTPPDLRPALGDQHAVPGLRWGEDRGRARAVAGVDVAHPLFAGHVRLRLRGAAVTDDPSHWSSATTVGGAEIGVRLGSPVGPIEVGWGMDTRGNGRVGVEVGRKF